MYLRITPKVIHKNQTQLSFFVVPVVSLWFELRFLA